jgi:hypothetical protein
MKSQTLICLAVSAVVSAACQHRNNSVSGTPVLASADTSPNDAIRTAIQAHLAHNGNLSLQSFDTEVKQGQAGRRSCTGTGRISRKERIRNDAAHICSHKARWDVVGSRIHA